MKKFNKFLNIELTLFPYDILVATEVTIEQILIRLKRYGVELDEERIENLKSSGIAHTLKLPNRAILIYFPKKPTVGVIAHEAFHATWMILATMGVDPGVDSEEVYAYMTEFIVDKIHYNLA